VYDTPGIKHMHKLSCQSQRRYGRTMHTMLFEPGARA